MSRPIPLKSAAIKKIINGSQMGADCAANEFCHLARNTQGGRFVLLRGNFSFLKICLDKPKVKEAV